jgi:hypothetical protein
MVEVALVIGVLIIAVEKAVRLLLKVRMDHHLAALARRER